MSNKIFNFVFLILLIFLQSCSGGKIGNFLETSFNNNNNSNKISQNDIDKKLKNSMISKDKILVKEKDKNTKIKEEDDVKPLNIVNSSSLKKYDGNTLKKRNQNYNPKSYRVFVILKKVDPSFPTENFSKVLRNGDINFEIEKIELMSELDQNKK
tara:strand:- start:135 stop:599 length:465 start_codon:yes stop_codon:yes gene_type:complete